MTPTSFINTAYSILCKVKFETDITPRSHPQISLTIVRARPAYFSRRYVHPTRLYRLVTSRGVKKRTLETWGFSRYSYEAIFLSVFGALAVVSTFVSEQHSKETASDTNISRSPGTARRKPSTSPAQKIKDHLSTDRSRMLRIEFHVNGTYLPKC